MKRRAGGSTPIRLSRRDPVIRVANTFLMIPPQVRIAQMGADRIHIPRIQGYASDPDMVELFANSPWRCLGY